MKLQVVATAPVLRVMLRPRVSTKTRLSGRRLALVRAGWVILVAFNVGAFIAAFPLFSTHLHVYCTSMICGGAQPRSELVRQLHDIGLAFDAYAAYGLGLKIVFALGYFAVASVIAWYKSDDWVALLVALFLVSFVVLFTDVPPLLAAQYPNWWVVPAGVGFVGEVVFPLCFYLFPGGQFAPRWTRWLLLGWIVWAIITYFLPNQPLKTTPWFLWLESLLFVCALATMILAQVYRYRTVSSASEREQTRWVVFGMAIGLVGFFGAGFLGFIVPQFLGLLFPVSPSLVTWLGISAITLSYLVMLCIPLSLGIAMLHSRLWDIDVVIKYTLVYSLLTAALVAIYAGCIIVLQQVFHLFAGKNSSDWVVAGSTLAIIALFQPLRARIQDGINRRFYRSKYDATYTLLSFSAAMRNEVNLDQLSKQLVEVVEETMQPTHVFLWLQQPEKDDQAAHYTRHLRF